MATTLTGNEQAHGAILEHAVDIHKPPEEVFDYCSDLTREPEWNPKNSSTSRSSVTDLPDLGRGTGRSSYRAIR